MHDHLTLFSEKFSPSGGTSADGVKKLLGSPALTLLQTVIRETVQNSWDARSGKAGVRYRIQIRTLIKPEIQVLRGCVLAEQPNSVSSAGLAAYLRKHSPIVMEISDWGTRGLGGPTRADVIPETGETSDFVNFVRNIGVRTDVDQRGGTYGYGKSSLYSVSGCSTVVVYTVTGVGDKTQKRFIACHLGEAWNDAKRGRMTGRHWWGTMSDDTTYVEPLVGEQAAAAALELGMPPRNDDETGTTLMILDPTFSGEEPRSAVGEIQEALMWFFWPKMLEDDGPPPIQFETFYENRPLPLPRPEAFPPLDLFVEAYRTLKQNGPGTEEINCGRPIQTLGRCTIRRGFRGERQFLEPNGESIIPHSSSHIALMRPVELVVRYVQGAALPAEGLEWAGVFICDTDPLVEKAFADSEPPAHDDWIPDKLPKGAAKTFVNVALREIRRIATFQSHPAGSRPVAGEAQPSLAEAADLLGRMIPSTQPFKTSRTSGAGRTGRGRDNKRWTVSEPSFVTLMASHSGREAVFSVQATNETDACLLVRALPGILLDGSITMENVGPDGSRAEMLGWESDDGTVLTSAPVLSIQPNSIIKCRARVSIPTLAAVGLRIEVSTEDVP